jgi:hypothetical protein
MGRKIHHRIPDSVDELLLRGNSDSEFGSTGHVHCIVVSREPKYGDGAPAKWRNQLTLMPEMGNTTRMTADGNQLTLMSEMGNTTRMTADGKITF